MTVLTFQSHAVWPPNRVGFTIAAAETSMAARSSGSGACKYLCPAGRHLLPSRNVPIDLAIFNHASRSHGVPHTPALLIGGSTNRSIRCGITGLPLHDDTEEPKNVMSLMMLDSFVEAFGKFGFT